MPDISASPLLPFRGYVEYLRSLLITDSNDITKEQLTAALDGEPSRRLRSVTTTDFLRRTGTFFSGSSIANQAVESSPLTSSSCIADPACGAGDLLIAYAKHLDIKSSFEQTIQYWGRKIIGCDIHPEFVEATKLRLCLLLAERGQPPQDEIQIDRIFPEIVACDGLKLTPALPIKAAVMNPPYNRVSAPSDCRWAQGNVSCAALFVDRWLSLMEAGGKLTAILPDVLRTGSNYESWRKEVLKVARVDKLTVLGKFDDSVDIDVFIADFIRQKTVGRAIDPWKWFLTKIPSKTVGDYFSVQVGRVVPHRDIKKGPFRAYLHSKAAPQWETLKRLSERIQSARPPFCPPFVVVRRTSSPKDKSRAVGTIVLGNRPVAVENHLLILKPLNGSAEKCMKLIRVLKSKKADLWLNQRIRCRHLTVDSLKRLPWELT